MIGLLLILLNTFQVENSFYGEINFYKKFAGSDKIIWEDISPTGKGKLHPDLNPKIAMKRFHIFNGEKGLLSGAAAFAALWTLLPAFRIYGIIARKKPIIYLLEFFYLLYLFQFYLSLLPYHIVNLHQ